MATDRTESHRPLRGGIAVWPYTGKGARGTLTAVARRKADRKRMLITNAHVVSTNEYALGPGAALYQGGTAESDKIGTLSSWITVTEDNPNNPGDLAALLVVDGVAADLGLHRHVDGSNEHEYVPIVGPVVDPIPEMEVQIFGATTGISDSRVIATGLRKPQEFDGPDPDSTEDDTTYYFTDVTTLNRSATPGEPGDSGAPCVWRDDDGNYRLVCIIFGGVNTRTNPKHVTGYAVPASKAEDLLGVTFGIKIPKAKIALPKTAYAGGTIRLDGSGSESRESPSDPLSYQWKYRGATVIPLSGATTDTLSFTAPNRAGSYTFKLTVTDSHGSKHSTTVNVTVVNRPPVANPGPNRVVPVHTPASLTPAVTLVGAAEDPDTGHIGGMTYAWSVVSAPSGSAGGSSTRSTSTGKATSSRAILSAPNVAEPTFTPTAVGDYVFTLTVTDPGDLSHEANVTIHACNADGTSQWYDTGETRGSGATFERKQTRWHNGAAKFRWVANNPPVANAGYNQVAAANTRVTLSGAAGDPDASDQDDLSYRWSKRSGAFVQMDGTSTLAPTFTAPGFDTTLKFRLTVTDPHGAKDTDNVTVRVYDSLTSPWHDTGEVDGCGRSKRKRQTRLNFGVVKFRWQATPEPVVWTEWEDTGETRNEATGAWTDTGSRRENPVTLVTEKEQTRAITWEKEQERTNQCDQTGTQWVDASRTETQWVEGLPAPTNVTATPSTRSVELSWDAMSGATGYEVEIGIPGNAGGFGHTSETTTDTTITISNLIPEKTYEYRVRGTTSSVDGPWTDWATVVTKGEEPPQPTNDQWKIEYDSDNNEIQAKVVSLPTVIPAISEVRLHMGSGQPPNRTTITKAIGTDLDTWVTVLSSGDTGWATDVTWAAHIRFENSVDESSYSLPGLSVTVPAPLPPLVENVTADPAFRSVELSWDAASGATGYEVEIGIPASAGGLGHTSHTTTGTSITVSSLNPAQTYEYRVRATNAAGDGPWTDWATVVTEGEEPPQPTSDQWNFRYSSNKLQAKVISLPTVIPVITEVELTMETGQPPNLNTVTKNIGTSLDTWVDVLTRGQTGWTTGTWIAQIRFRNSVDYGPYSDVKSDTVPTVPTTPDPDPCTWRSTTETRKGTPTTWTHVRYSGCGPDRRKLETRDQPWEKKEECVLNGVVQDTRWVYHTTETEYRWLDSPEPYRWRTVNDGSPTTTYTAWTNLGEPYLSGSSCKQVQIRQSTTVQRRKQVNHCNDGFERPADPVKTTTYQRQVITVTETWGNWSYTGGTDYDDIEDIVYYEQERYSYPCNRRDTRWVTTRP